VSITVTVVDDQTGDRETQKIADGDYLLITVDPCYKAHVNAHANGTHVLTVKGRKAGL
jgi:hypothetical protein